jgi:hypothetical protein
MPTNQFREDYFPLTADHQVDLRESRKNIVALVGDVVTAEHHHCRRRGLFDRSRHACELLYIPAEHGEPDDVGEWFTKQLHGHVERRFPAVVVLQHHIALRSKFRIMVHTRGQISDREWHRFTTHVPHALLNKCDSKRTQSTLRTLRETILHLLYRHEHFVARAPLSEQWNHWGNYM